MTRWLILAFGLGFWSFVESTSAGDWPQILGPHRTGIAEGESIRSAFPKGGPETAWEHKVGSGFAGPAVADGKVIIFHRVGDEEIVEALDAKTGERLWRKAFPADDFVCYSEDKGPRCVPLIHKDRVYLYGARGDLHCVDFQSGEKVWSRDLYEEYNSGEYFKGEPPAGYFGIGTTPIVVGDRLLVNAGGDTKLAGIVAFRLDNGKTIWKATSERASYSSPIVTTIDDVQHVIFAARLNVVSVDPETGDERFRFEFGRTGPTVTAALPVIVDDHIFVSASYRIGAKWLKLKSNGADPIWESDDVLSTQYATPILDDKLIYGLHGRQDGPPADLKCIDPQRRTELWSKERFGYATMIKADGKLVTLTTEGELVLVKVNPKRYEELARAMVFDSTTRALPALSNGFLYARDTNSLKCLDLRAEKSAD